MPGSTDSSNSELAPGKKWLIRLLIIVGIGVPVIIELTTFSGLITSQLFSDQEVPAETSTAVPRSDLQNRITTGDTLFAGGRYGIKVQNMYLRVRPDRWQFLLQLVPTRDQKYERARLHLRVNRLYTGNRRINEGARIRWKAGDAGLRTITYALKAGEQPKRISFTLDIISSDDTLHSESVLYRLGHVPARYAR